MQGDQTKEVERDRPTATGSKRQRERDYPVGIPSSALTLGFHNFTKQHSRNRTSRRLKKARRLSTPPESDVGNLNYGDEVTATQFAQSQRDDGHNAVRDDLLSATAPRPTTSQDVEAPPQIFRHSNMNGGILRLTGPRGMGGHPPAAGADDLATIFNLASVQDTELGTASVREPDGRVNTVHFTPHTLLDI